MAELESLVDLYLVMGSPICENDADIVRFNAYYLFI